MHPIRSFLVADGFWRQERSLVFLGEGGRDAMGGRYEEEKIREEELQNTPFCILMVL